MSRFPSSSRVKKAFQSYFFIFFIKKKISLRLMLEACVPATGDLTKAAGLLRSCLFVPMELFPLQLRRQNVSPIAINLHSAVFRRAKVRHLFVSGYRRSDFIGTNRWLFIKPTTCDWSNDADSLSVELAEKRLPECAWNRDIAKPWHLGHVLQVFY